MTQTFVSVYVCAHLSCGALFHRIDDLPPDAPDDQPMPKTLSRLLKSSQQITVHSSKALQKKKASSCNNFRQESDSRDKESSRKESEGVSARVGDGQKRDQEPVFKRQRGESLKAYLERIDIESNARLMEAYRKSRGKSDRRKRCGGDDNV